MIIKKDIWFEPSNDNRKLHIYLPKGYDSSDQRYPVMYFFDGHNLFHDEDATYGKSWGLEAFMDQYDRPMIIVGLECGHDGNTRLEEYSPYDLKDTPVGPIHGRGKETLKWMRKTLKPQIDQTYRTLTDRQHTGIGGSSMGGLMSYYAIITDNDIYSKAACLSSSFPFCEDDILRDTAQACINGDTRIYFSFGSLETGAEASDIYKSPMATITAKVNEAAFIKGATTYVYTQIGGAHNEASWEKQNGLYMDFLWKRGK